ncbi:MAG: ABC transporter ATP-binding protein [Synechococcus sp.]|nr:ABC transporter ATP-binding protein [Synechococcus sp.]
MASVTFEQVTKRFDDFVAVNNLNLTIEDGEFLVFVGPSGCGKTTSLRLLAGLESITDGQISIGDRPVNHLSPKDRDIAMVFQSYALYPHMSVYENMAFSLQLQGIPKKEIKQRVRSAAAQLGIEKLLHRKPKELSGGQRQRVAVGRAIVRKPAVFLMDEPLSNLDAKLRVQARKEISKLHQDLNTTFIYVTHDQTEAMTMGDRIAVMKDGILQQVDSPANLYNNPNNLFVAGFIGSPAMNFFEVNQTINNNEPFLELGGNLISIPQHLPQFIINGDITFKDRPITLGIRPEDIYHPQYLPPDIRTIPIQATVNMIEMMGNELIVYLETTDHVEFVARFDPRATVKQGETLNVQWNVQRLYLFDREMETVIA